MKSEKSTAQNYLIPVMIRYQVHPSAGTQTDSSYRFWVYPIPYRLATRTSCAWREGIEIGWIEAYGYPNVQVFGDHISRGTNYGHICPFPHGWRRYKRSDSLINCSQLLNQKQRPLPFPFSEYVSGLLITCILCVCASWILETEKNRRPFGTKHDFISTLNEVCQGP